MVDKEKIKAFLKTSKDKNEQAKQDSKDSWADVTPRFSDNSKHINDDLKEEPKKDSLGARAATSFIKGLSKGVEMFDIRSDQDKIVKDKITKEVKDADYLNIKKNK